MVYCKRVKTLNSNHNYNYLLPINKKYTHTLSNNNKSVFYIDSLLNKSRILIENKDRSGIYR